MLRTRLAATVVAAAALTAPLIGPADAAPKVRVPGPAAGMTLFATHPMASKTAFDSSAPDQMNGGTYCDTGKLCPVGRTIIDMNVDRNGQLVAGYGDWGYNADTHTVPEGRIAAVPLDLTTVGWGTPHLVYSEAIEVVRRAPDGSLWIPKTDPSGYAEARSGVATNASGTWRNIDDGLNMIHTFDVSVGEGGSVWLFGARYTAAGASGVVATSTGASAFAASLEHRDEGLLDWSRFYSGVLTPDGTVHAGMSWSVGTFVLKSGSWQQDTGRALSQQPRLTERFAGGYVTVPWVRPVYVAGGVQRELGYPEGISLSATVRDLYVDFDGALFYLADTTVVRVDPTTLESRIIATGVDGTSIVVHGGRVYAGSTEGRIFRSVALDTDGVADEPTTAPAPTKGKGGGRKG